MTMHKTMSFGGTGKWGHAKLAIAARVGLGLMCGAVAVMTTAPAHAGRGSTPGDIQMAIQSNSTDAICAELEHAEHLYCPNCVTMVKPLLDHSDYKVRQVAAWWMARHDRSGTFISMVTRLGQPDSTLAGNAADVLGELKMAKAVTPLAAAMTNPIFSADARAAMARALGSIGHASAVPALVGVLAGGDAPVKVAALASLRSVVAFTDPGAVVASMSDADPAVRGEAIYTFANARSQAMKSTQAQAAVTTLVNLVANDTSPEVRKRAAWALGEIGAPAGVASGALTTAATNDADPGVRSLALGASARLH